MKQAQGMQQKLQEAQGRLADLVVDGVSGSGRVALRLKGSGELVSLTIGDELMTQADAETLADLVVAAHADAKTKLDAASQSLMRDAMGPLAGLAGVVPGLKI